MMAETFFLQGIVEPRRARNTATLDDESRQSTLSEDSSGMVTDADIVDTGILNGEFK